MILCIKLQFGIVYLMISSVRVMVCLMILRRAVRAGPIELVASMAMMVLSILCCKGIWLSLRTYSVS